VCITYAHNCSTVFYLFSQVASALALFDEDGDGFLELSELVRYLEATFRVLYAATPGTAVELRHTPKTIAQATAQQCFLDAGANSEQAVSAAYFQAWYNRGQGGGGGDQCFLDNQVRIHTTSTFHRLGMPYGDGASGFEGGQVGQKVGSVEDGQLNQTEVQRKKYGQNDDKLDHSQAAGSNEAGGLFSLGVVSNLTLI
jgi:hypothetical protein